MNGNFKTLPSQVPLKIILSSPQFREVYSKMALPVALGSTSTDEPYIVDLTRLPHLLIAGTKDTCKTMVLHAIITSLLFTKKPSEIKFVLIDPKNREFSQYRKLGNYYLSDLPGTEDRIITDCDKAVETLQSLRIEMDNRYDLLLKGRARNIAEYNEKYLSHNLDPLKGYRFLPYIVVVIDELADLQATVSREIEGHIVRLAQMARAVGIHLVIATQRPTTDVITGTIKANFNSRIAFKVNSGVDSKAIIDVSGAQLLFGRGDMLVLYPGHGLVRVQCAMIDTPEIERITKFIVNQPEAAIS